MKPVPTDPVDWVREYKGVCRFLNDLQDVDTSKLGPWKSKMKRYYKFRLKVLRKHRPKGILRAGA